MRRKMGERFCFGNKLAVIHSAALGAKDYLESHESVRPIGAQTAAGASPTLPIGRRYDSFC